MIGIVIVSHGNLASELLNTLEMIIGQCQSNIETVAILSSDKGEDTRRKILEAIETVDQGAGTLILTDMFGGSATNISLSLLRDKNIDVLTGVNLPMLMKLCSARQNNTLDNLKKIIYEYGQNNIILASDVLTKEIKKKCG